MAIVANTGNPFEPTDKSYNSPNRTTGADPNGVLTPQFIGEIVLDTANKKLWKAEGAANNTWVTLTTQIQV